MLVKYQATANYPVRIDATENESRTLVAGLECVAALLKQQAYARDSEAEAIPLLEIAGEYESLAERIRDEIE